ncbi:hypothetical protein ACH9DO_12040 [Kocuria sp. M1N1S27]|uniref:hypothetical protein n=1 Tax=Kocuria kalidii TaxID=3376283 RepID=UPI0037A339ED
MSTLRKTLASTAVATVLLGGSLAGPAAAHGGGHDHEKNGDSNNHGVYCEEDDKVYRSWWAYDEYCEDEHDEDDGKWYLHKGVWFWHDFDEDDDEGDGKWRHNDDHGWKHHHDHDKWWDDDDKDDDKDDDEDDERDGKKRYAEHRGH